MWRTIDTFDALRTRYAEAMASGGETPTTDFSDQELPTELETLSDLGFIATTYMPGSDEDSEQYGITGLVQLYKRDQFVEAMRAKAHSVVAMGTRKTSVPLMVNADDFSRNYAKNAEQWLLIRSEVSDELRCYGDENISEVLVMGDSSILFDLVAAMEVANTAEPKIEEYPPSVITLTRDQMSKLGLRFDRPCQHEGCKRVLHTSSKRDFCRMHCSDEEYRAARA